MNSRKTMILALVAFASSTSFLSAISNSSTESESIYLTPGQHHYFSSVQQERGDDNNDTNAITPGQQHYYSASQQQSNYNGNKDTSAYYSSSQQNPNSMDSTNTLNPNMTMNPNMNSPSNVIPKPANGPEYTSDQPQITDVDIAQNIKAALKKDPSLSSDAKNLRVAVSFGHVTISGMVNGETEKEKVNQIARRIAGIKSLESRIDVISNQ